ncbi:MAG TPA: MFS transporter [Longimicrobiales bacterium]|nr:MFS transporter [Trueperaceae bacterium]HKJ92895.1 MFS transporter [Longimicrobiales bacterium]
MRPPSDAYAAGSGTIRSRVIDSTPFFYGWMVLAAGTFGMMMTTPGQTLGVSVFLDKIIADLGVSRSLVSLLYTVGTVTGSFALPFVGRFIDRRGPRLAVVAIAALFALACGYMGTVRDLAMLLVGFVLIRGLGQGSLSLVSQHVVNLWFVRRRGFAVGLTGLGMAAATAFFPMVIDALIQAHGWRQAYALLGLLVAVTVLPVGALLFRSRPERYGLAPDGRAAHGGLATAVAETNYSLPEARRTRTFWLFVIANALISALTTGLIFHHFSIMAAGGLDRAAAARVFVPFGAVTAAANLVAGVLMDRVPPRFLLAGMLVAQAAALGIAATMGPALVLAYGALLGLTMGMKGGVQGAVFAYYFGRRHLGAVKGTASTIGVVGTAAGPPLFALAHAASGAYAPVLLASAVPALALAGVAAFVRPFRPDGSVA